MAAIVAELVMDLVTSLSYEANGLGRSLGKPIPPS